MTAAALVFVGLVVAGVGIAAFAALVVRALDGLLWDGSVDEEVDR